MNRVLIIVLLLNGFTNLVNADTVIFLGGWGSTSANMACWKKGAEKQSAYSGYKFRTIAYPSGITGGQGVADEENSARQIKQALDYINANPNEQITLVAHSSGSSVAYLIEPGIKNPANVSYVSLAGFSIPKHMYRLKKVTAIGNPGSYGDCPTKPRWCRHFSLVNKTPPTELDEDTFSSAYEGCNTNLSWLKSKAIDQNVATAKPQAPTVTAAPSTAVIADKKAAAASANAIPPKAPIQKTGVSGSLDDEGTAK